MTNTPSAAPSMPAGMPQLDEVLLKSKDMAWRPKSLRGVYEKVLWRDEATGASICLIKFDKGTSIPEPHLHAANQFMFCLEGNYEYKHNGLTLKAGSFYWNPKGNVHGPTIAHEETIVVEIFDGPHYPQRPSWYDNDEDAR
jgi:quercetin dioxygenase-like cupin family protein